MPSLKASSRLSHAVAGVVAALAGMAAGHLVAAVTDPSASPVLAVGSSVINATPTPVKDWAVRTLGTHDKPVLVGSVAVVTVLLAALVGVLGRGHRVGAAVLLGLLAGAAGAAALTAPTARPLDALPAGTAVVVGVGTLLLLSRLLTGPGPSPTGPAAADPAESPLDHSVRAPGSTPTPGRRSFLVGVAGVGAGAAVAGTLGQVLAGRNAGPAAVSLPAPSQALPPLPAGLHRRYAGISPFRTPLADFYRVDTALVVPQVDAASWTLQIDGRVEHPLSLTFAELTAMPLVEKDITLNCVSNEVGGPYVSSARWLGVPVAALLERAGLRDGVDQILSTSTDGMTISTPVEALTDDRGALVVVGVDGGPLPAERGFPARLLTPGLYGYVGATKWLTRLTATTYAAQRAYWTRRGWATDAPVRTQTRIDTPQGLRTYDRGTVVVGGVAWSQAHEGISAVEVRVDDGPWQQARLGPDAGVAYWRQWFWPWDATSSGRHTLTARAVDGQGSAQSAEHAPPFPSGASGYHSIVVLVG